MKKYLAVLLALALCAAAISGCGNKAETPQNAPEEETSQPEEAEAKAPSPEEEAALSPEENAEAPAPEEEAPYYGTWTVTSYQFDEFGEYGGVTAISAEDMEAFLGVTVTYQADSVLVDGEEAASGVAYEEGETYTYDTLLEDYHVNLGEWWNAIPQVTAVSVSSEENFFGSHFFLADENTVWIYYEGAFFMAR